MELSYNKWKTWGVVESKNEKLRRMIGSTSRWGGPKALPPMVAAVLCTLYKAGPDIVLTPKDMVNQYTRRAHALAAGKLQMTTIDLRGQTSCGVDEFEGSLLTMHQLYAPSSGGYLTDTYAWKAGRWDSESNWQSAPMEQVRFTYNDEGTQEFTESGMSVDEIKDEFLENYLDGLKESYVTSDEDISIENVDRDNRDEYLEYLLKTNKIQWWRSLFSYRMFDMSWSYTGKCGWENKRHENGSYCSHHYGSQTEQVLVYKDEDSNDCYLDEYEGDEEKLIADMVSESNVIKSIKAAIPKLKTESRRWIKSTWATTEYTLKDENEPDAYKNRDFYPVQHGKRGHYTLTHWSRFAAEDEREAKSKQLVRQNGTISNGWVFVTNNSPKPSEGWWEPVDPIYHYSTFEFTFRTKVDAERVVKLIMAQRHLMVGRKMTKNGALLDPVIRRQTVDIKLQDDTTTALTPKELVDGYFDKSRVEEFTDYGFLRGHVPFYWVTEESE